MLTVRLFRQLSISAVLLAMFAVPFPCRAQLPPFDVSAELFHGLSGDFGALAGAEYPFLPWLSAGVSFAGYAQRPLRQNWLTRAELTLRDHRRIGLVCEMFVGAGVRDVVVIGDSYEVDKDGSVHERGLSQIQFAYSVGLGVGWTFERLGLPLRVIARADFLFSAPYFQETSVDLLLGLRASYSFGGAS